MQHTGVDLSIFCLVLDMCIHRCESSTVSSSSHHFFSSIFYCDREDAERVKKKEKFREREREKCRCIQRNERKTEKSSEREGERERYAAHTHVSPMQPVFTFCLHAYTVTQ
jgi:hypothetical protein